MLSKRRPLSLNFIFGNRKKMTEGQVLLVERAGDNCHIRRRQKLLHNERRVSRSVVMMLEPGVIVPLLWKIALDVSTSIASELRSRIFHSPSVLVEQIPCAQCLQYQTFATFFGRRSGRRLSRTLFIIELTSVHS
jgi:hypothetical protein